jgi:hypothetical protein
MIDQPVISCVFPRAQKNSIVALQLVSINTPTSTPTPTSMQLKYGPENNSHPSRGLEGQGVYTILSVAGCSAATHSRLVGGAGMAIGAKQAEPISVLPKVPGTLLPTTSGAYTWGPIVRFLPLSSPENPVSGRYDQRCKTGCT